MSAPVFWFDDRALVAQLPAYLRLHARYCRAVVDRRSGVARGGSFLHRALARGARALALPREARVRVGGTALWVDPTDPRMFWTFDEVQGEGAEAAFLRARLGPGDSFLDLGANHGSFALLAARAVGPRGAVVAFEPQPRLAALLRRSLEDNGFAHARVAALACGEREAEAAFYVPEWGSGMASVFADFAARRPHRAIRVRVARLDDVLRDAELPGRLVVKVDVEGSELACLRGASELLRARRPALLLEINPTSAAAAGYSVAELLDYLCGMGYHRFGDVADFPRLAARASVDLARQYNLVALAD